MSATVLLAFALACVASVTNVAAFAPAPAGFWWLNSFLDNQTIGRYETFDGFSPQLGPCPNQANKCQINLATLPQAVKNIGVTLPSPFSSNITLGQALPSGFIQFWYTEINDVQLGQVSLVGAAESSTRQSINVTIKGFKANVGLMLALRQIPIPIPGNLDVLFAGTTASKSLQGNGTDINFILYVDVPPGKTFANSFPSNITMGTCSIKLSLGLAVNPARFSATTPFSNATVGVTNLLLGIAEPLLGNAVCGIIRQLFYTFDGQKGLISTFVTDAYDAVGNLGSNVPPSLLAQDLNFSLGLTETQRNNAFNFATSNVVKGASVVANNWLGQPSESNPTVNEVVNLLTSPTNGSATYSDLASLGLSIPLSTPVADITVDVDTVRLSGMNTFGTPYGFQLIKNNYDYPTGRLNWTLDNKFSLNNLGVNFLANITLVTKRNPPNTDGWIYVRNPALVTNSAKFKLNYTLSLVDLDIALALSLAMNPSEIQGLKIGQLLGKQNSSSSAVAQAIQAGKCSAPSMYGAAIPFLQLNLSDIITPVFTMTPPDAGITELVNDATTVGLTILKSATTTNLPDVSQYWVRPLANSIFKDFFTAGGADADCPDYVSHGVTQLNLRDSTIFRIAKNTIANAVGGDPVRISRASINELVAQFVAFLCEAFASSATCQNPSPGVWQFYPAVSVYPGKSFPAPTSFPTSIAVTGLNLNGVNSVYKLLLSNVVPTQQGFNLLLELGQVSNPLIILLRNRWRVDYPTSGPLNKLDIDESFNVTVNLQGFRLNLTVLPDFDLDQLYQLTLNDVTKSACLLAPFAANFLDLQLSATSFNILVEHASIINNGNPLQDALEQVATEQGAGYPNITTMFNFVLQSVGKFASNTLSGLNNTVINATNCATQTNSFDTFILRVGLAALSANLTDVLSKATSAQPAVLAPALLDDTVFQPFGSSPYNLQDALIPTLVNSGVKGISQPNFNSLMQNLGNNSGDVLSDIFFTEPDLSVSLDVNFTQFDFFKDGFDLSFLIENATLFLNRLRLTNITALDMATLDVIKPVSKFVLDTNISFHGRQDVFFSFGLLLPQSLKGVPGPRVLTNVNITLSLVNLKIALQTLTALDAKRVNGLSVGNFLTVDSDQTFGLNSNAITCLLRLFLPNGLSIPKLLIGLDSLGTPLISASNYEFISQGTIMTINAMLGILADFYIPDLADLTQGGLRVLLNEYLLKPNLERPGVCVNPTPPPLVGNARILNFKSSSTVARINDLTSNILAGDNGEYTLMNTVLAAALDNKVFLDETQNRQIGFNSLEIVYKKVVFGTIGGAIRDIILNNVGTFTGLNLLNANTNTSIANNISIAGPLDFGIGITWFARDVWTTDFGEDGQMDEIRLDLQFTNITIGFNLDIELDIPELFLLQSGSLTNFSQIACVFTAVKRLSISDVVFDVDRIRATVTCDGVCESPLLKGIANGIPITSGDNNAFLNSLPTLLIVGANFLQSSKFGSYINDFIDSAGRSCNQALDLSTVYSILNPTPIEGLKVATIFALALLGIAGALFLLAPLSIPRHYQLKDKMLAENLLFANSQPGANAQSVARFMAKMERDQIALAWHPAVNKCCKCFVPVMALINVILLGLSFIGFLAFSLQGRLFILGGETRPLTLVPWSVSSTINDMWNSGAWPLSILIVFASCAWPVAKNIALFAIWYAPKTFLSHAKRDYYLVQLDVLGKWSFLDVYIINILVGGLKMTLSLGGAPALQILPIPSDFFVIDTVLTPETGIILLATAAYMSLVVNHVIMWEMYKAEWADRRLYKQIDGDTDDMLTPKAGIRLAISEYVFSTTTPTGQRDRYGPKAKNTIILMLGVSMVWLIVGYSVPYMAFNYDGLIGYTIGFFISGGRKRPFSLFQFGMALPAASTGTHIQNATFTYFAGLYFITVIIAPMLQMIIHLFLWLRPLSLKDAHTVLFFAKVAAYWASLEVFCLGIVATTIEIKPVTTFLLDFITGGSCAALKAPLTSALDEQNGACLNPSANLEWGFAIAFTANLFQIFCGAVMIRASGVAIRDREDVLERRPHPQWTYLEYLVLDKLLVHGAAHHKPPPDPERKKSLFEKITVDCAKNPSATCSSCLSATASKLNCCSGCFAGVNDVALTTPVGKGTGKVANSKWNAPSTMQSSNKWNSSYGAPPSANPSWNMSQAGGPTRSQAMVANSSMNMDSPNPVFARETQKRYSIDV